MQGVQAVEITGRSQEESKHERLALSNGKILLCAMSKVAMTEGGPTRTNNTGTHGKRGRGKHYCQGDSTTGCQPALPGSQPTETQPDPVVAMPEFGLHSAVCRTTTVPTDQYIG